MIGTKLAHYEITAHLGSGGTGDVYQATDTMALPEGGTACGDSLSNLRPSTGENWFKLWRQCDARRTIR